MGDLVNIGGAYHGPGVIVMDIDTANVSSHRFDVSGTPRGETVLVVHNLTPNLASGEDIALMTGGAGDNTAVVHLDGGDFTVDAFDYDLEHIDGNVVLAGAVNSTGITYGAASAVLSAYNRLPTLRQRVGQQVQRLTKVDPTNTHTGVWMRGTGVRMAFGLSGTTDVERSQYGLQASVNFSPDHQGWNQFVFGVTAQYARVTADLSHASGSGSIESQGMGVGATATWYGDRGTYVDSQMRVTWIDSDFASSAGGNLADNTVSHAYSLSLEGGHRFALTDRQALVPQAQVSWGQVDGATFALHEQATFYTEASYRHAVGNNAGDSYGLTANLGVKTGW